MQAFSKKREIASARNAERSVLRVGTWHLARLFFTLRQKNYYGKTFVKNGFSRLEEHCFMFFFTNFGQLGSWIMGGEKNQQGLAEIDFCLDVKNVRTKFQVPTLSSSLSF